MVDLKMTNRQQEIFDFIKRYASQVRLSADGARDRQGGRPRFLLDGARPPRQPREVRRAAPQPDQAARDRGDDRQGQEGDRAREGGLPLVGQVAAGQPVLAEENIEEYVQVPRWRAATRASTSSVSGESMRDAGILAGDYVVVPPQDTRAATATSSSRCSGRRRP